MTAADPTAAMVAAARQKHHDTRRRAIDAIRRLDAAGHAITFAAVAQTAGISRAWLYRDTDMHAEIDRLRQRTTRRPATSPRPAAEQATIASLRQQLDAAHLAVAELKDENKRLRDALARKLGHRRGATDSDQQ